MSRSKKSVPAKSSKKKQQLTEQEHRLVKRFDDSEPKPTSAITIKNGNEFSFRHKNQRVGALALREALGTQEEGFFEMFLGQIANAASKGPEFQEENINFMLSVIKGIEPRDQIEAMLGAQMAAIHMASMTFTRRLNHVENIPQQDAAEKALNKLMRTFTSQMEALRKYRTGGEQKVTVQHVQVNEGGQAVVGNINQNTDNGGGGNDKN